MINVQAIDDIQELASLRLLWHSWLSQLPRASFQNTLEWLETYWQHFGRDEQLRALVVRSSGKPIGIVPLSIRTCAYRYGHVRVLGYPLDDWVTWYGPLGSDRAVTMLAAMQYLRRAKRDWDQLDLRWTVSPWSDGSRMARSMGVAGMATQQQAYQTTFIIGFSGGWEAYLASRSKKVRRDICRALRRVAENPQLTYIRHRPLPARDGDGDPAWDLYAMCQQVALASWQSNSRTCTTITHDHVRNFLRDAHAVAARRGMVDMNLLLVDGRPAAFSYNYHYRCRLTALGIGYDASLARGGFGKALMLRALQDSFERGDESYDFGQGECPLKRDLRTTAETSYRLTFTSHGSWRSQMARLARLMSTARPRLRGESHERVSA
jgi:CelD/BcsL family acetyltransferase involved in cellulose biosynthesis